MWVQIKQRTSENIESESLVAHVALSKEREAAQEKRLNEIEKRNIEKNKKFLKATLTQGK